MHIYIHSRSSGEEPAARSGVMISPCTFHFSNISKGAIERFCNLKTLMCGFVIVTERSKRCHAGREAGPATQVREQVASGCLSVISNICCVSFPLGTLPSNDTLNKTVCDLFTSPGFCRIRAYQNSNKKLYCWQCQSSSPSKIKDPSNTATQPRVRVWTVFFSKLAPSAGQREKWQGYIFGPIVPWR